MILLTFTPELERKILLSTLYGCFDKCIGVLNGFGIEVKVIFFTSV